MSKILAAFYKGLSISYGVPFAGDCGFWMSVYLGSLENINMYKHELYNIWELPYSFGVLYPLF